MSIICAVRRLRIAPLLLGLTSLVAGCGSDDDTTPAADAAVSESLRGNRYCEVLLAFLEAGSVRAQVWGTQGLNDCPEAAWASVDPVAIRTEFGATAVVLNGPRRWLIDGAAAELPAGAPRLFGTLELQQLAMLMLAPGTISAMPYVERTVLRNAEFEFRDRKSVV